jgi:hypothetical protein
MRRGRRLASLLAAAAAMAAVLPGSALANSFSGVTGAPTSLQAGAHSDFNLHIGFTPGSSADSVKDLTIALPPGEIGDPNATPFCSTAALNADSCPANTAVGTASTSINLLGLLPSPLPVTGNIYNVQPHAGEPARFGIALHALPISLPVLGSVLLPPVILQSGVQLRQNDFGLSTVVNNAPNSAALVQLGGIQIPAPISITGMNLTLDGIAPGTGKPFLRNPTSCSPHQVGFVGNSWAAPGTNFVAAAPAFTPTGCANLPFSPTLSARVGAPGSTSPGRKPTNVSTSIDQKNGEAGLLRAQVQVPNNDLVPDANLLGSQCDPAAFLASACPSNTVVGSAVAASPLLTQPLSGPVEMVSNGTAVPNVGLDLNGQLHLLLQGSLTLSELVQFDGLPDIPISHFALTFGPQPGLLQSNRNLCAEPHPVFHADFLGYNGATSSVDTTAKVDGCGGTAGKCKKSKKKHKRGHKSEAAAAKKHHKKQSCGKHKRKKKH